MDGTPVTGGRTLVELTVSKIDVTDLSKGADELIAWRDTQQAVFEVAQAWAQVRGHSRVIPGVRVVIEQDRPLTRRRSS